MFLSAQLYRNIVIEDQRWPYWHKLISNKANSIKKVLPEVLRFCNVLYTVTILPFLLLFLLFTDLLRWSLAFLYKPYYWRGRNWLNINSLCFESFRDLYITVQSWISSMYSLVNHNYQFQSAFPKYYQATKVSTL